jgi:hypothetical protein
MTHARVLAALRAQRIETPWWGLEEKIYDAATVHRFTGVTTTVSLRWPGTHRTAVSGSDPRPVVGDGTGAAWTHWPRSPRGGRRE